MDTTKILESAKQELEAEKSLWKGNSLAVITSATNKTVENLEWSIKSAKADAAEIAALREALKEIAALAPERDVNTYAMQKIAREALKGATK